MDSETVDMRAITDADVGRVAAFFTSELNPRVTPDEWAILLSPPWTTSAPNHGFQLLVGDRIVGAYAAVYSERIIRGESLRICNLAAFCVLDEYRAHSFRLMRAILGQKGFEFTDLSPSGNVVALNERLGFVRLDTTTRLVVNLPGLPQRGLTVTSDPARLASVLQGDDARIYADHRLAPAAHHLLVTSGDAYGYVMFRRDRRKGLPLFATPLFAGGDLALVERAWPSIAGHLLVRHGAPATLAEHRVLGFTPRRGVELASSRAKMFRSKTMPAADVDYLYSEMTLVEW
jgi:hypothetical protein